MKIISKEPNHMTSQLDTDQLLLLLIYNQNNLGTGTGSTK